MRFSTEVRGVPLQTIIRRTLEECHLCEEGTNANWILLSNRRVVFPKWLNQGEFGRSEFPEKWVSNRSAHRQGISSDIASEFIEKSLVTEASLIDLRSISRFLTYLPRILEAPNCIPKCLDTRPRLDQRSADGGMPQ